MKKLNTIVYSQIIGDLFHYGHLKMLESARNSADYHICGVISDEIVKEWAPPLICNFEEREGVVAKIKYVDETMIQNSLDPTENLKKIHKKYLNTKIFLLHTHIFGGTSILGSEYIKYIKGEIIVHEFYSNLSRDYIKNILVSGSPENHDLQSIAVSDIKLGDFDHFKKNFSTKANTIQNLRKVLQNAQIEKEFIFTVEQWESEQDAVLKALMNIFHQSKIVIRSSSLNEDSVDFSNAGHFESVLNVDSSISEEIVDAIRTVIKSYHLEDSFFKQNQILVQKQTQNVAISGVVFTRNLWSNTPYYLINYDDKSKRTDTVTSGISNRKIEIHKDLPLGKINSKWYNLFSAIQEIESFFKGITLDIEFAVKETGEVVIFQVRPLAANSRFHSLDDDLIKQKIGVLKTEYLNLKRNALKENKKLKIDELYFSDMAFWNPAELIGDRPNHLDYSLFNYLLMKSNWNKALLPLGFTRVDAELMVLIANKPYINVHNAFLSLLPEDLPTNLKSKLLKEYNNKLWRHPELHDKIEFEIVHNCYRFDYESRAIELKEDGFSQDEIDTLKQSLVNLTNKVLSGYKKILEKDSEDIRELENRYEKLYGSYRGLNDSIHKNNKVAGDWNESLYIIFQLIEDCKTFGTIQFSRVARMAFIGDSLLKSLCATNTITTKNLEDFRNSMSTVATDMDTDFNLLRNNKLSVDKFLNKYGHLRPGTYDITKLPYHKNKSYFFSENNGSENNKDISVKSAPSYQELKELLSPVINIACKTHGIFIDGPEVLEFIKTAIELREYYKFIYTKNISLAIEILVDVGESLGFTREQLSNLDYYSIVGCREFCSKNETIEIWQNLINGRIEKKRIESLVSLPPIIFSQEDFEVVPSYVSKPNFITHAIVEANVIVLDKAPKYTNISDKIVVIEKADPGYDWIFTKKIKGLVTKYGGAASHMAIRCAEFNIAAAIGCGDVIFSQISKSQRAIIDCKNKTIKPL